MSDYSKRKRIAARNIPQIVTSVVNKATPVSYQLKKPALFDFYEGEAPLDWPAIVAGDALRVIFQATVGRYGRHGNNKPDYQVADYVKQARINGQKYGLYHLLLPNDTQKQIDFYLKTVADLGGLGNMPPIVDIEYIAPLERKGHPDNWPRGAAWAGQIKEWLDGVEEATGQKAIIYTSNYYWPQTYQRARDMHGNLLLMPPTWAKDYIGWFAGYPWKPYIDGNTIMPRSYLPSGFRDWGAWQYSETGRTDGYPSNDLSLAAPWLEALLEGM